MAYTNLLFGAAMAVAITPSFVSAATVDILDIVADEAYTDTGNLVPGSGLTYNLTFAEDVSIPGFALAATGNNGGSDVENVTFGFTETATNTFLVTLLSGGSAAGVGSLPGGIFSIDDDVTLFFTGHIEDTVGVTVSFVTETIAPIPVPASGLLLGAVLAGGAGLARRRRKETEGAA